LVRDATGFAIGGVAPVAHEQKLPLVIDASLARFDTIYAAAGHPYCVFATTTAELARLTGGALREDIGKVS
jgi:prolyl-tRNA editing enzyme YbaK/EbsC (Cys-tRNA(Pro) deacylase)